MKYSYLCFVSISLVWLACCSEKLNEDLSSKIKSVIYIDNLTDTYLDGKKINNKKFMYINYYKDYVIYQIPILEYKFKRSKSIIEKDTIKFNEELESADTTYKYFTVKKGSNFGIRYSSQNNKEKKIFRLDSLYKSLGIDKVNMEIYNIKYFNPIESKKNAVTKKIEFEKFIDKNEYTQLGDTIYRFYNPSLNWVEFSIADEIERGKKTKLCKYVLIQLNKVNKGEINPLKTELSLEIVNKKNPDSVKLYSLFQLFEADIKTPLFLKRH